MNVLVLEASTSAAKAMVYNENTGILHGNAGYMPGLEWRNYPELLENLMPWSK